MKKLSSGLLISAAVGVGSIWLSDYIYNKYKWGRYAALGMLIVKAKGVNLQPGGAYAAYKMLDEKF